MRPEPIEQQATAVDAAFAAAAIPAPRRGRARTTGLDEGERALYAGCPRRFADGARLTPQRSALRPPSSEPTSTESSSSARDRHRLVVGRGTRLSRLLQLLKFFKADEHALPNLLAHPEVSGHTITIPEAIAAGAAIFADLLEEDCHAHTDRP